MFSWDPLLRAATLGMLGQEPESESAYRELLDLHPDFDSRPESNIGCCVHTDKTLAAMLDGLRVAGLR